MKINIKRVNKGNKEKISGDTIYNDTKFTFTIHSASKENYKHVLVVSVISPTTGHILQLTGKPRNDFEKKIKARLSDILIEETNCELSTCEAEVLKKERIRLEGKLHRLNSGTRLDELNVRASAYLLNTETKTIEKHVETLVKKLYGDNCNEILKAFNQSPEVGELSARVLYDMYQNAFFRTLPAVSPKALKEKKNAVIAFCNALERPISHLTNSDINKAIASLNKTHQKHIKTIEKFFDYIGEQKTYRGPNPITQCLNKIPKHNGKHSAPSPNHLSATEDKKLHALIASQLEQDGMALAIPLAKGFKLPVDSILKLTWKDIIIVGEEVLIQDYREKYTGGTHNYLRPPLREAADFIIARYQYLDKTQPDSCWKQRPLVSIPGNDESEKAAKLSKYFRRMLQSTGVTQKKLKEAIDPQKPKAKGGAGYALLSKHYDYVLRDICGVDLNSGIGHFLRAVRIHDTTTDYYRCLTDETGNHFLEVIMRRDGYANVKIDETTAKNISSVLSDDKSTRTVSILPGNTNELTGVLTKKKIFLPAGSTLVISAQNGIRGSTRFSERESISEANYKILY